jgi:hypothetical protein
MRPPWADVLSFDTLSGKSQFVGEFPNAPNVGIGKPSPSVTISWNLGNPRCEQPTFERYRRDANLRRRFL